MNAPVTPPPVVPPYKHTPLFPLGKDTTTYRKITSEGVKVEKIMGKEIGQGLKSLINKMKAHGVDALLDKLDKWAEREAQKAIARELGLREASRHPQLPYPFPEPQPP